MPGVPSPQLEKVSSAARRLLLAPLTENATPEQSGGRFTAAVVMLSGIGLLAVISASVTAELVESNRRRVAARADTATDQRLKEISERLARIEAALEQSPIDPADRSGGAG